MRHLFGLAGLAVVALLSRSTTADTAASPIRWFYVVMSGDSQGPPTELVRGVETPIPLAGSPWRCRVDAPTKLEQDGKPAEKALLRCAHGDAEVSTGEICAEGKPGASGSTLLLRAKDSKSYSVMVGCRVY